MKLERKALIVGINNYPKRPLKYAIDDAVAVNKLLEFNEDDSRNFKTNLVENVKTISVLKGLLAELFTEKLETALFYFSGHGVKDNFGFHIVTPDGEFNDWGISMSDLMILANDSPAKNRIIILDCCYAGGCGDHKLSSGMPAYIYDGVTILSASRKNETAKEINGHGIFTNLMIEGLKGGAADLNGDVSPGSLYAYIDKAMGEGQQRPVFKTNISEFVSLRRVQTQILPETLHQIVDLFPDPEKPHGLNPSYEFTNNPDYKNPFWEPFTNEENVKKFKALQKMVSVGLVTPVDAEHMYFAAMDSKSCRLTPLGKHYWELVRKAKEKK